MKKIVTMTVTFFGVGFLKPAPGTWGTLATLPLWWVLCRFSPLTYMVSTFLILILGIVACSTYENIMQGHDHSHVVIDEVIGFLITMLWLPMTWQALVAGFILFRLLDVTKPFPIGYLDRKVPGGLGVVIDDVVAGVIANLILQIVYTQTSWLGGQWIQIR